MTISTIDWPDTVVAGISTISHHVVIVREAFRRHGRFEISLAGSSALSASRTPLLSAARHLLGEGADPSSVIELRHAGNPDVIALSGRLGSVAKLDVHEGPNGPRFRRWTPPPSASVG